MSGDLVAFLRARLDEDEQTAREALKRTTTTRRMIRGEMVEDTVQPSEWRRSVWPPARVLRDVEAKRRIVERHADCGSGGGYCDDGGHGWDHLPGGGCAELADLAVVYADHPDYREEWRL